MRCEMSEKFWEYGGNSCRGMKTKTAVDQLYELWDVVHKEENSLEYIEELCTQLKLFGTQSNKITREFVLDKLEDICESIKHTLNN
jgi:hypothetical protein